MVWVKPEEYVKPRYMWNRWTLRYWPVTDPSLVNTPDIHHYPIKMGQCMSRFLFLTIRHSLIITSLLLTKSSSVKVSTSTQHYHSICQVFHLSGSWCQRISHYFLCCNYLLWNVVHCLMNYHNIIIDLWFLASHFAILWQSQHTDRQASFPILLDPYLLKHKRRAFVCIKIGKVTIEQSAQ
jgi:hypothetical protein